MEASIPYYPLVVVPVVAAVVAFWRRGRWHLAVLRRGRPLDRTDRPWERIKALGVFVFGQRRLLQDLGPGLTHAFVFWGFVVLLATTGNYLTNGLVEAIVGWPFGGFFWSVVIVFANLFVGLVLASVIYYVVRRTIRRPARLALTRDAFVILGLIFFIVLTELIGDAFGYVVEPDDPSRDWAILAGPLSLALDGIGAERALVGYGVAGWAHILLVLGFGAYLPYSKHLHIISSEPNVYFRSLEPRGALRRMDLEAEPAEGEPEPVFGARGLKDLTWRHLLDGLACTECGRCMEFCPASVTGKTLSPKHLMEGLRDQIAAAETALAAAASAQRAWKGGANGGARRRCAVVGEVARRGGAQPSADGQRHPGGGRVAVHDLRLVRRGLPGAHRARRHDRRDPPQRGPGGVSLPEGAGCRVPQHGERRQPVGPAQVGAPRLGQGAGRVRPGGRRRRRWHRPGAGRLDGWPRRWPRPVAHDPLDAAHGGSRRPHPLLGRLRRRIRRSQPQGRARHGAAPPPGRCPLRGPGSPRDLHR
jgi:ferredoxin